jgi:hypothetical protein
MIDDVRVTDCCLELICPSKVTAECQTANGAPVAWTVVATNHCGQDLTVTCMPAAGKLVPARHQLRHLHGEGQRSVPDLHFSNYRERFVRRIVRGKPAGQRQL